MMSLFTSAAKIIANPNGDTNDMAHEDWRQVKDIFNAALRQKPEERPIFLDRICDGDKIMRREVESLLSSYDDAESFMEKPAIGEVAESVLAENPQLSSGQNLGHYKIIRQIGAGGMGKVFLATDTKLNRKVALKVLHQNLLLDNQANGRLLREAQATALLDHPHICAIHEISETDDCSFIVMQYVEGKTLADVLTEKSLSVEKSLDLAIQIADALEEAHAHNIIHRDIKPANIIVNERWQAKVLDFGLAKFVEAESNAETAKRLNSSGAVMGTVPYMSPEQLRGKRLDARTDIFSFGAMFYEMLCGRQAFAGESHAETISAILNDQPDWTKIPRKLQPIVRKSLMKNKDERYQTANDLMRDLRDARQSGEFTKSPPAKKVSGRSFGRIFSRETARQFPKLPGFYFWKDSTPGDRAAPETESFENAPTVKIRTVWLGRPAIYSVLTIFLVTGAVAFLVWQFKKGGDSRSFDALRSVRLVSWKTGVSSAYTDYSASHNGKMIAYSSTQSGENENIYVKQTAEGEDIRITKDEWKNHSPVWSPDDQRIAFVSRRENQNGIYVSPSLGGAAVLLTVIGEGVSSMRHWSKDSAAIFYELGGNLFRLDLATKETAQMTDFAPSPGAERFFSLSPEEDRIAYCDNRDGQTDVWVIPVNGGAPVRLTDDKDKEMRPLWHPDGKRILYNAVRENHSHINLAYADGSPPEQVTRGEGKYEMIGVSTDGTKIFYTTWEKRSDISGVKIESGEEFELAAGIESEFWADVSPDGKRILFQTNAQPYLTSFLQESSIVVKSLADGSPPLSLKGYNPRWLPDSRRIAFLRWQKAEQKYNLWLVNTASGEEKQITMDGVQSPSISVMPINRGEIGNFNFSPDGSRFVYLDSKKQNVRAASVASPETFNLTNNGNPNVRYESPLWSPDGKRIVYLSTEKPAEKTQKPRWSVWLAEQGKPKEIFSTPGGLRLLGWSALGGELFLEMTDGVMKPDPLDIKLLQVSVGGENRIITTFKNIYADSMKLSADGKMVAFTARQNDKDDIFTAATGGGEAKKITANGNTRLFFGSPAWSPDGKTIFFDKQDQINTISMFENFK
ncbi:MAG: serine/threonine-protein kinase [Acidobacteriota bacterium]|nr:serine/threonine-protein kinase [Acidobacteriota bacterium]